MLSKMWSERSAQGKKYNLTFMFALINISYDK